VLTLLGEGLTVSVLDPRVDRARLGSRYVAGGYVWQVTDERHGALLAGPQFPAEEPWTFDGQGLPEVFETALGADRAQVGDEVYVIGVGRVRRESALRPFHVRDNPTVTERAAWALDVTETRMGAETYGELDGFALRLARTVEVVQRTVVSSTHLRNEGARVLPVRWFAHPFLPWAADECCRLSLESALPDGAPLVENERGFLAKRRGIDWSPGHYVKPRVPLGGELRIEQCHPALGVVRIECHFPLGDLALWGNANTFSCEPFFQTLLERGTEARWSVAYTF
jgi:hypothetical protein